MAQGLHNLPLDGDVEVASTVDSVDASEIRGREAEDAEADDSPTSSAAIGSTPRKCDTKQLCPCRIADPLVETEAAVKEAQRWQVATGTDRCAIMSQDTVLERESETRDPCRLYGRRALLSTITEAASRQRVRRKVKRSPRKFTLRLVRGQGDHSRQVKQEAGTVI